MAWHYVAGGAPRGPVDDAQLDRLIAAGIVTGETLVWHAGLDGWKPLHEVRPDCATPPPAPPPAGWLAAPGQARPRPDPDAEFARTASRRVSPIASISRGARLVFAQPGPTIGISALIMVMMIGAGFLPCVGTILQLAIMGPLTAAWYGYFLRHIRGQAAALEDVFAVFSSPDLLHMVAVHVITWLLTMLILLPLILALVFTTIGTAALTAAAAADHEAAPLVILPLLAIGAVPIVAAVAYLSLAFMFAPALILDRGHAFWPAMRLSQKVVNRRLLPMVGLLLLAAAIGLAGVLALCVGIFVAMPIVMASNAYTYEDLFGERHEA